MANRKLQKTVKVAGILLAWWIFSVTAGIYNKAYLDIYSMPIFLTVSTDKNILLIMIIFLSSFYD
jgi:hypothetical protein